MTHRLAAAGYLALLLAALLACANGPSPGSDAAPTLEQKCGGDHDIAATCNAKMRATLRDPDSADFASVFNASEWTDPDCSRNYRSFVDAKSGLGPVVRTNFACVWSPKTKAVTLKVLH